MDFLRDSNKVKILNFQKEYNPNKKISRSNTKGSNGNIEYYYERIGRIINKYEISLGVNIVKDKKTIIYSNEFTIKPIFDVEVLIVEKRLESSVGDYLIGFLTSGN